MRTLTFLGFILPFLLTSCLPRPAFAPNYTDMPTDPYGASIKVSHKNPVTKYYNRTEGELIAIENDTLIVLTRHNIRRGNELKSENKIIKIEKNHVHSYIVHYARLNGNRAYMLSAALIPLHGFYLIVTAPINLLLFFLTEEGEQNYFSLSHKDLKFENLYQFARFPQGIPEGLDPATLRTRQD